MRPQINRLPETAPRGFAGTAIDRSRPLRFRLDGRLVSGFAGDTVLSAALAAGIDTIGLHLDNPIGLTMRAAPAISHENLADDPQSALPMARTPALDGAEFVTVGVERSRGLARLFQPGRTLGLTLSATQPLTRPWKTTPGGRPQTTDVLVIGGGVAGLSAALAAARAGLAVTLVEARPFLGGQSGLFGTQEGEDAPDESMSRLSTEVAASEAITVLTSTHVFAIRTGLARIHQIDVEEGKVRGRVIDITAGHIVIATGSLERLPIFGGNRLPGVMGTLDAYELATRFGVWPGQNAIFATGSNPAYRLAMLASDAEIGIGRILDSRPQANSRFIAFSRAYGIVQSPGTIVSSAGMVRAGGTLSVHAQTSGAAVLVTDRLLVCGGWQPDLTLWHIAGGTSRWHGNPGRLEAEGQLEAIALAGSAAGYLTRRGCIQSGADAIDQLLGRTRRPVEDPVVDPLYETPDGPTSIANPVAGGPPAYLDGSSGLLPRPEPAKPRLRLQFWQPAARGLTLLAEAPQPLTASEVAAGVDLKLIPEPAAGIVAQERVASISLAAETSMPQADAWEPIGDKELPVYLTGRFGEDARLVRLVPDEPRALDAGALIFPNSDTDHPALAVGVVLRHTALGPLALVAAHGAAADYPLTVRDKGQIVRVRTAAIDD